MSKKLTNGDLKDLQYFWQYKGDLSRMVGFEELIPTLESERPEIMLAWRQFKAGERILNLLFDDDNLFKGGTYE